MTPTSVECYTQKGPAKRIKHIILNWPTPKIIVKAIVSEFLPAKNAEGVDWTVSLQVVNRYGVVAVLELAQDTSTAVTQKREFLVKLPRGIPTKPRIWQIMQLL